MGDIVDFEKAKEASIKRKEAIEKRKKNNLKITKKYYGNINTVYYYIGILVLVIIFTLIK